MVEEKQMEKEKILKDLEEIAKKVLEDENLTLREDMSTSDIKGWDSLSQINIIEKIETFFNVRFSIGEIVVIKTIGDFIELIQNKIKK